MVYRQINKIFNVATEKVKFKIQGTIHVKWNRFILPSQGICQNLYKFWIKVYFLLQFETKVQ